MSHAHPTRPPKHELGGWNMMSTVQTPRRTVPTKDASVLHEGRKRQKLGRGPEKQPRSQNEIADGPSRVLHTQESSSSDQSASKWFNSANKNVSSTQRQHSELDNDPPFYMSNHPNYIPTNFVAEENDRKFGATGMSQSQSRLDSENKDLRGVIDDLTIENKRLRQMIRIHSKQQRGIGSDISQQDKLFEVRIHGLPPEKRRELELLLKNFATTVHSNDPSNSVLTSSNSALSASNGKSLLKPKRAPAPTVHTDSGYASNSPSGQHTSMAAVEPTSKPTSKSKAVRDYLQDIPDALLPKRNPLMSERAKQVLVVRRLEQLFVGKKADPGTHDQPMQQQEISHSAAHADRMHNVRDNKKRKAEGSREAHIMPPDTKINLDTLKSPVHDQSPISQPGSPDQRPTRPLDLNIDRAQVAAENISYIEHLGLLSGQLDDSNNGEKGPWIFLNLLIGLAQLHTLNVTPDFIRRALKKWSKHFELSKDGRKVKWIGGSDVTKFAMEDERTLEVAATDHQESIEESGTSGSISKRSKTNSSSNAPTTSNTPSEGQTSGLQTSSDAKQPQPTTFSSTTNWNSFSHPTKPTPTSSAFDYKPLVYKGRSKVDFDQYKDSDESFESQSEDSSGLVHALSKSDLNLKSAEEGLITFYNNPFFCSDFSADNKPPNMLSPRPVVVGKTLGVPVRSEVCESPLRHHDATYFVPQFADKPFQAQNPADEEKLRLYLPPMDPIAGAAEDEIHPFVLEACGLGGVTPEDNFALHVVTHITKAPSRGAGTSVLQLPFSRRKYLQKYFYKIGSCEKIDLLPSKLPPPSYIFYTPSSSSDAENMDDTSDDSDSNSLLFVDEDYPAPPAFLQKFSRSSGENLGNDDDDDGNSSDIDMLAIARQINPQQVAEQERAYMINEPGGVQRAVAGSLAATVGASRSASLNEDPVVAAVSTYNVALADKDSRLDDEMDVL